MYGAGELNERIKLFDYSVVDNGYEDEPAFAEVGSTWAKVTFISDGEKYSAGSVQNNRSVRFIIRKRTVKNTWQIEYAGSKYAIIGIKPVGRSKEFLEITAGNL